MNMAHENDCQGSDDYTRCREAVKRLNEFLDHELEAGEAEKVQRHLQECRGCFAKFHFEETLLRTIHERAQAIRAPSDLRDKILGLITANSSDTTEKA